MSLALNDISQPVRTAAPPRARWRSGAVLLSGIRRMPRLVLNLLLIALIGLLLLLMWSPGYFGATQESPRRFERHQRNFGNRPPPRTELPPPRIPVATTHACRDAPAAS